MSKRNTNIRWSTSLDYQKIQAFTSLDKVLRENEIKLGFWKLKLFIRGLNSSWFSWIKPGQTGLNRSTAQNLDRERVLSPAPASRYQARIGYLWPLYHVDIKQGGDIERAAKQQPSPSRRGTSSSWPSSWWWFSLCSSQQHRTRPLQLCRGWASDREARQLLCHGRRVCLGYEPHRDQAFSTAIDEPRAQERSSTNPEAAPPEYLVGVILVVNSLLAELHRRGHLQIVKLESSNGDFCPFYTSGP